MPEGVTETLLGLFTKLQRVRDSHWCAHRDYFTGFTDKHPIKAIQMLVLTQGNAQRQAV